MKDMSGEMAKEYIPKAVESHWYKFWEQSGFFKPQGRNPDSKKFVIVLPPPNVTGHLHLGHALTGSVEDSIIRYHRMLGHETLFLPGTDHAGIATQVVVEKRLKAETGKTRHDFGREEFLKHVWDFKNRHGDFIRNQVELTGLSLDWSRERFTLDDVCAKAVKEAFVSLHESGKIYRATRLVNWCCALQSAISDLEVEMEDVPANAKWSVPGYDRKVDMGQLTHVAYKVVGSDEEIIIATTRPETILGDTAVAVHPEDPRYKALHGKKLQCPFRDAEIPIVLDATLVDMEFGTGAVKITPAHDPNDFECGRRHGLEQITILDQKGFISMPGEFHKMHRFEARWHIVQALEKKGLLRGVEGYAMRVGRCSRTGDIVEPMLVPQWYVDCADMAAKAVAAVEKKELKIIPESHTVVWYHWLKNIQPWCVSRQLWWGHRIPAYRCTLAGQALGDIESGWVVGRDEAEAKRKAGEKFNLNEEQVEQLELQQDPDVLDTWFSSGLWPFSVFGWPDKTSDLDKYFPGNLLETGHDILFFWVARMVMLSLHFHDKLPFSEVFLHAMVRDKDGRKMSKSLGNVIDPLYVLHGITLDELHETVTKGNLDAKEVPKALKFQKEAFPKGIPECGSDALRFGLLSYTSSGRSVNLDIERVVGYRQFCNKLWNVVRYILFFSLKGDADFTPVPLPPASELPLECAWILSRLDVCARECNAGFTEGQYDFAQTTNAVYRFWLYELCDVFLELSKPIMQLPDDDMRKKLTQSTLLHVVESGLRLLHPMMPFVTEELWHRLPHRRTLPAPSIMVAEYPQPADNQNDQVEADMKLLLDTVHALRSVKASYNLTNKTKPPVYLQCTEKVSALFAQNTLQIQTLAIVGDISIAALGSPAEAGAVPTVICPDVTVFVGLKGMIDVDKEIAKLEKTAKMLATQIEGLEKKMAAPTYESKVPKDVRDANELKHQNLQQELAQTLKGVEEMKKMK